MDYREALHNILKAKGCSIFGRPFQIDQEKDRDKCIDWILNSIVDPMLVEMAKHGPRSVWDLAGEPPRSPYSGRNGSDGASMAGHPSRPTDGPTEGARDAHGL